MNREQLIEEITKTFVDKGMIIEGGWQTFLVMVLPPDASEIQKKCMRTAFFAGAQHLYASILTVLEPGQEATDKDLDRMRLIDEELRLYVASLNKG